MALAKGEHELPNLKIEIENDLEEAMDVDDIEITKQSTIVIHGRTKDVEEGEVCESKDDTNSEHRVSKVLDAHPKTKNSLSRGDGMAIEFGSSAEIFDGKHNENFGAKSMKFGLTPAEVKILSEDKLSSLYRSLDMKDDEGTYKRYRLDAVHMRGTQEMSTEDVFAYFKDYSPGSIEWINDYSCNIVWISNMLAAKAIMELSKPIRGLEGSHVKDPFAKEDKSVQRRKRLSSEAKGDDVVVMVTELQDQFGEVLMVGDEETGEEESSKGKLLDRRDSISSKASEKNSGINYEADTVHVSEINIPIPPGFWRLGKPSPKAKQVLLRFSLKTDRKPAKAEKMSDYYKKHGNPNYGGKEGIKGLITKSRKRRFREKNAEVTLPKGNPWGSIAETWGNIDRRKAMNPEAFDRDGEVPASLQDFPGRLPVPVRFRPGPMLQVTHVHQRLHMDSTNVILPKHFSPDPESDNSDEEVGRNGSSSAQWKRKIKQPRMRMYADEEEERVERRREQQRREAEVAAAVRRGADLSKVTRTPVSESRKEASQKKPANVVDLRQRLKTAKKGTKSVWNRLAQKDTVISDEEEVVDDDRVPAKVDLRASLSKKTFEGDLRSKLNRNKTLKQNSPLRIEIDNDEYYRITGGDQD